MAQKRPDVDDKLGREPHNVRERLPGEGVGGTSGITKSGEHEQALMQIKSGLERYASWEKLAVFQWWGSAKVGLWVLEITAQRLV